MAGSEAPWSFDSEGKVDKKTLKLLTEMPVEMLATWEAKHPAKWSIHYIVKHRGKRAIVCCIVSVIWILVLFAITLGGVILAKIQEPWFSASMVVSAFLVLYSLWIPLKLIDPREKWEPILESFEIAVRDPILGLENCLVRSFESIKEMTSGRLAWAAGTILDAETAVAIMRTDSKVTEKGLLHAIQNLLQFRSSFDRMLERATEFGLSDGNPQPYFQEAERRRKRSI